MLKVLLTVMLAHSTTALGQTKVWDSQSDLERKPAATEAPPALGWHRGGVLNANLSFTSSQDVVGQVNGSSQTYGINSKGSLYRFGEQSEWRNDVFLRGSTTRTPNLNRFVKSEDELKLATIYLYKLESLPQVGPYARAEAAAPLFRGEDVRPADVNYTIKYVSGVNANSRASTLALTDAFRPLTTKEAVGFFYRPFSEENFKLEARLGAAASQVRARGQLAVEGADTVSGNILVRELADVNQAGLEAGLLIKGKVDEKTSYEVGADALTPFINNKAAGDKRTAFQLTNVESYVKLVSKLNSWASFGYDYKLRLQPQLVERAQQIHMMVLNITYGSEVK